MATTTIAIAIEGRTNWIVTRDAASHRFIASCPALKLTLEDETFGDLMQSIEEGLSLLLTDIMEDGEREFQKFLAELGWTAKI